MRLFWTTCLTAALLFGFLGSAGAATFLNGSGEKMIVGDTLQIRDDGAGSAAGVDFDITLTDYVASTATWTFVVTVVSGGLGGDDLQQLGVTIVDECSFTYFPNMNCLDGLGTTGGGDTDVSSTTVIGTYTAQAIFDFDAQPGGLLNVGETSDPFFVSYGTPLLRTTGNPPESIVNFMINGAGLFGDQNITNRIVPEPSILLLMSLGIAGLAVGGRRRRA